MSILVLINGDKLFYPCYLLFQFLNARFIVCCRFTDLSDDGQSRYVVTSSMLIGPSYILQFDLVIGCSYHFLPSLDHQVSLEFSTDHGMTWDLVKRGCWPPRMCEEYHQASVYDVSQFAEWTRVTIILPPNTWYSRLLQIIPTPIKLHSHFFKLKSYLSTGVTLSRYPMDVCGLESPTLPDTEIYRVTS